MEEKIENNVFLVDKNTEDIYVQSRDRQSPHRLAAKDGQDDGRAYHNARAKAMKQAGGGLSTTTTLINPKTNKPFTEQIGRAHV